MSRFSVLYRGVIEDNSHLGHDNSASRSDFRLPQKLGPTVSVCFGLVTRSDFQVKVVFGHCVWSAFHVIRACATGSVALERNWTVLDRCGVTANLYMTSVTDSRFDDLELFMHGDGVHWQWGVLREMNMLLLQLLETYWPHGV